MSEKVQMNKAGWVTRVCVCVCVGGWVGRGDRGGLGNRKAQQHEEEYKGTQEFKKLLFLFFVLI